MDGWYFLRKHILLITPVKGFCQSATIVSSLIQQYVSIRFSLLVPLGFEQNDKDHI